MEIHNNWYAQSAPQVLAEFSSGEEGLSAQEVAIRLKKYGLNKLPESKIPGLAAIFGRQFSSPLIYILFAAAAVVFLMGQTVDALIIFAVLFFNAIVGTVQEGRAQNTLLALKKFSENSATVLREDKEIVVRDFEVVPGDIIVLREGEKVPADARIIFANAFRVDEASFTGESKPVSKIDTALEVSDLPVADRKNMVFKGTHVTGGNAQAVVVATGLGTEIGKIAKEIVEFETEIPLKVNIRYLSRFIIFTVFAVSFLLMIFGLASGKSLKEMFITAVALSVSIIPEGLPIVMTLVLATGVWRISKNNVLVKKLQAVEALGQTKVIAVDKTGTITKNEMVVQGVYVDSKFFQVTGVGYEPKGEVVLDKEIVDPLNHPELLLLGKMAAWSSGANLSFLEEAQSWRVIGDPTEAAMLVFSEKIGFRREVLEQESPKVFDQPFDYQKKYHAVIHLVEGKNFLTVVGAPEEVLGFCKKVWHKNKIEALDKEKREEAESAFIKMAQGGFRVVAYAFNSEAGGMTDFNNIPPLVLVGFIGMKDALRPEVVEAIRRVKSAGMRIVMITGDHLLTAQFIAKEAEIYQAGDLILTGDELDRMTDHELAEKIARVAVFARVAPEHKLRIIQAYRKLGEIVAMTGDGVNDAPSLVAADLGVAMGKIGTEVAKEASDIVLLDDNFGSIVSAAEEGRSIYKTIKKVILYLFSTSVGEVFTITGALMLGFPLPILPAQIIWLNFVTDGFLDMALAMEPKEKGLLRGKFERPKKWLVDGLMSQRIFFMAIPMAVGTLFLFKQYFVADLAKAWTISLTALAVFQWFNAWNCRSENKSIFQKGFLANKFLVIATVLVVFLQLAALYTPFLQKVLRTHPITFSEWLMIIAVATSIILVEEIRKIFYRSFKK